MSEARINLPAKIFPTGNFETHEDIYGKGGFVVLNDELGASVADDFINERITYQRRKEGMLVYISSDNSYYKCSVTGSSESEGRWSRQYFSGRYFQGPSAPTASDLVLGEKWFNTEVGSEFTYLYTDEDQDTYIWVDIDHLGQGETGFVRISGDTMTGTLTGTNASFTGLTASNGFIGTLTADRAFRQSDAEFIDDEFITKSYADSGYVKKSGDTMFGTLTGTDASFTGLTASNGFIGTLTGNNIRYTNAEFGTDSLVIQGSFATFTDMSVMITGNSTFDINDLSIGTTFTANVLNQNVYRIFADDGVALGGNTLSKNNWLGNNVFLTPQEDHSVMIGFPTSTPVDDSYAKLMVKGGIITKRIFSIGSEYSGITAFQNGVNFENIASAAAFGITTVDGYEHPLLSVQDRQDGGWVNAPKIRRVWPSGSTGAKSKTDDFVSNEYVTKSFVNKGFGANYTIIPWGDSNVQLSFIKTNLSLSWSVNGSLNTLYTSQDISISIPNAGSYPNIISVVGTVADSLQKTNHFTVKVISDTNTGGTFGCNIQMARFNSVNPLGGGVPDLNVNFIVISSPS